MMHKEHKCQIRLSNSLSDSTMITQRGYIFEETKQSMYFPFTSYLFLEASGILLSLLQQSCFQKLKEKNLINATFWPNSISKFRRILKLMVYQAVKTSQVVYESIQLDFVSDWPRHQGIESLIIGLEHLMLSSIGKQHHCILLKVISSKEAIRKQ